METMTLENKVIKPCGYCNERLQIPQELHRKIQTAIETEGLTFDELSKKVLHIQYTSFYVSGMGSYYCNKQHFDLFTED